jgi:hypothetical protein
MVGETDKRPGILRRLVRRGGKRVEIEQPVRETR